MRKEYNTKQKKEIYNYLLNNKEKHYTPEELFYELKSMNINIGQTTVYRYLEYLNDRGIVRKYKIDDKSRSSYQFISDECKEHYHLKCIGCGKLIHTHCSEIDKIVSHFNKEHNFVIDYSRTILYGMCDNCNIENN